ncbi:MAG: hypothetical protein LW717_07780, partial [Chloroflexaceae bacterium]|nr:hypothetical protein [Chloroflexaceae bacterium]
MRQATKIFIISVVALGISACGNNLSNQDRLATLVATAQMATMTAQVPTDIAATAEAALTQTAQPITATMGNAVATQPPTAVPNKPLPKPTQAPAGATNTL